MANKPIPVGIARIHPRFDGEFLHWLGMDMVIRNLQLFQLDMGMGMRMYIFVPSSFPYPPILVPV